MEQEEDAAACRRSFGLRMRFTAGLHTMVQEVCRILGLVFRIAVRLNGKGGNISC